MRIIDKKLYKRQLLFREVLDTKDSKSVRDSFTKHFAQRVKEVRKAKGLTQEQVAYLSGLSDPYYGHIEAGRYHISLFLAWKVARALDVELDELIDLPLDSLK